MTAARALLALVPALSIACANAGGVRRVSPLPSPPFELVAVAPVILRYGGGPLEAERRTEDVHRLLWQRTRWPVLTARELTVIDPRLSDPLRQTDAVLRIRGEQIAPDRIAFLRTIASLREARGRATVSSIKGSAQGALVDTMDAVVSIELIDASGRRVVEGEIVRPIDPLAARPDWDVRPEIRDALGLAVSGVIEACPHCATDAPPLSFESFPTPAVFLNVAGAGLPPGVASMGGAGLEEDRDLVVWRLMQYFEPSLTLSDAERLERLPPAFCVTGAGVGMLRPGDCVVGVGTRPVTSPHTLRRLRARLGADYPIDLSIVTANGIPRRALAP